MELQKTHPCTEMSLAKMNDSSILKSLMREGWNTTADCLSPGKFDFGNTPTREHHIEAAKIVDGTHEHFEQSIEDPQKDELKVSDYVPRISDHDSMRDRNAQERPFSSSIEPVL